MKQMTQWHPNDGTNYYALETFVDEVNLTSIRQWSRAGPNIRLL